MLTIAPSATVSARPSLASSQVAARPVMSISWPSRKAAYASPNPVFAAIMGFLWLGVAPLVTGSVVEMFGLRWQAMISGLAFVSHQFGSFLGAAHLDKWLSLGEVEPVSLVQSWGAGSALAAGPCARCRRPSSALTLTYHSQNALGVSLSTGWVAGAEGGHQPEDQHHVDDERDRRDEGR